MTTGLHSIVVVPCYNEARRLQVGPFREFLAATPDVSLCFVNDGSTDDTRTLLERMQRDIERVDVLNLDRNAGKAEAVRRGLLHALGRTPAFVGYWDADLATPLPTIVEFRNELIAHPRLQMVLGARVAMLGRVIERQAIRHYFGRVIATAASVALGLAVYDTQCGAKLLRADRAGELLDRPFIARWMFDVELLARIVHQQGSRADAGAYLREIPLREWRDVQGSKVSAWDGLVALRDVYRIYRRYPPPKSS